MALTIDNLEIKIDAQASQAISGIDALANSLNKLRSAIGDTSGLTNSLLQLSTAMKSLASGKSFLTKMNELNSAIGTLDSGKITAFSQQMQSLAQSLVPLQSVEKGNFGSVVSALKSIPKIAEQLDPKTIEEFSAAIKKLVVALEPLATQMEKVSRGFSMLPGRMKSTIKASQQVASGNSKLNSSYNSLTTQLARSATKMYVLYAQMKNIANIFADAYNSSNEYVEALNLFEVSLGSAGDSAMSFAEKVSSLMGIDIAEWITNQGSFMRMSTGFGIASDQAEVMSQNLTQLAYDMSSFFNVDVQTAMDKLQSGMSGQIKGLKEWGYNLSVAALEETALSLGIDQSVRSMTEAQKAQLRYITLIQRSQGVMGDMAKTINIPANSMRVLSSMIDRLQRAFGNLVSVLVTEYIPYVMAFVELMEEAATALAKAWGFEIPKLPDNNLEMGADVIEGIGDEADEAADKVSELKNQLMGFDEINILKSGSSNSSASDGALYDLGFDMPEYDFLNGLDASYRDRINQIKDEIRNLGKVIENIMPLLITFAAVLAFEKLASTVSHLGNLLGLLKGMGGILTPLLKPLITMKDTFILTGDAVTSAKVGWETFSKSLQNLNPLIKGGMAIAGIGGEFLLVKKSMGEFLDGDKGWFETVATITADTGAIALVMGATFGVGGVIATAIAGALGALVAFAQKQKEVVDELTTTTIKNTFYDGMGQKISDIANAYKHWADQISTAKQAVIDIGEGIASSQKNISDITQEITRLASEVTNGYQSIAKAVPQFKELFQQLYDDSYAVLSKTGEMIYAALAGATGKALEDAGYNLDEYGKYTSQTIAGMTEELEGKMQEMYDMLDIMNSDYSDFDESGGMNALLSLMREIAELSGVEVETSPMGDFLEQLNGINWESAETAAEALKTMSTAASEAKASIEKYYSELVGSIERLKEHSTDAQAKEAFGEMIEGILAVKENELKSVNDSTVQLLDRLQNDMLWNVEEQISALYKSFEGLNVFQKTLYKSPEDYVKKGLDEYLHNTITPLAEEMSQVMGESAVWIESAMSEVISQLFDSKFFLNPLTGTLMSGTSGLKAMPNELITKVLNDFGKNIEASSNDINNTVSSALGTLDKTIKADMSSIVTGMSKSGEDAVNGLANGLNKNENVIAASKNLAQNSVLRPFDTALRIHSPSKEMENRGLYVMQGLANGIDNNSYIVVNSFDAIFAAIEERFDNFSSSCQSAMEELTKSLSGDYTASSSIPSVSTSSIGSKTSISGKNGTDLSAEIATAVDRKSVV